MRWPRSKVRASVSRTSNRATDDGCEDVQEAKKDRAGRGRGVGAAISSSRRRSTLYFSHRCGDDPSVEGLRRPSAERTSGRRRTLTTFEYAVTLARTNRRSATKLTIDRTRATGTDVAGSLRPDCVRSSLSDRFGANEHEPSICDDVHDSSKRDLRSRASRGRFDRIAFDLAQRPVRVTRSRTVGPY